MAPKKATSTTTKKSAGTAPAHASYQDMIKDAILKLKERNGSSRQAIKKYIHANNSLPKTLTDAQFSTHISRALANGEKVGEFTRPKGPSGPVKLAKKDASKPKAAASTTKTTKAKTTKTGASKPAAAKKAAAPKKASATKATTTKKTATKANSAKPRKTAPAAPAVEEKKTVLSKTKSGRVTKTTAPAKKATTAKKASAAKPKKEKAPKKEVAA